MPLGTTPNRFFIESVAPTQWCVFIFAMETSRSAPNAQFGGIALAYNGRDKAEVDRVLAQAKAAGAKILKPAQDVFWGGYSGYFADLDGHPWEVAFNPHWPLEADGSLKMKGSS